MEQRKLSLPIIIGVVAGLVLVLSNVGYANAQAGMGLGISPLTFELTANPGDKLTNKIRIYNPTDTSVSIRMEIEDFTVTGEMGKVIVVPAETETYSLAHWIKTDPGEFTLGPKEQKFVDFIIEVPQNAEPGGKYGSILASITGAAGELGMTGAATISKVGALVLLTVSGEVKENLIIKEFSTSGFWEKGPISFVIRFANEGTIHVRPKGFVTITDWQAKKVIDIPFSQKNVIPGAVRRLDTSWNKEWVFGKFTATLVGSYGTTNTPLEPMVLTFWVFPWKIALAVFLGLFGIAIFFYKTRRRWQMALRILIKGEKNLADEGKDSDIAE